MADNSSPFIVSNLTVRPTATAGPGGVMARSVTVTFTVGSHGPFTLQYVGATVDPQKVAADVKAQVDQLKAIAQSVMQMNQQP